jgi:hypothetical protein
VNLLRGLSHCYSHLKALINRTMTFPTFHDVQNEVLLDELTMVTEAPAAAPALYSTPPDGQAPSGGGGGSCPPSTGLLSTLILWSLWLLVRFPPLIEVVALAWATAGVAAPPGVVLQLGWWPSVVVILQPLDQDLSMWPSQAPSAPILRRRPS